MALSDGRDAQEADKPMTTFGEDPQSSQVRVAPWLDTGPTEAAEKDDRPASASVAAPYGPYGRPPTGPRRGSSAAERAYSTTEGGQPPPPLPPPPPPPPPPPRQRPRWWLVAVVSALIGSVAGGAVGAAIASSNTSTKTIVQEPPQPPAQPAGQPNSTDLSHPTSVRQVLTKVQPGVVSIRTNLGAGTGMIITPDGEVLTNYHVISGATSIRVNLFDETNARAATLLGGDQTDDVALLKIQDAANLVTVTLGDSASLQVGDGVVAIGNALNLPGGPTVTSGIISAKDRNLQDPTLPQDLIQTDAAINPGNSGGPLANANGEVVGMNTLVIQQANSQEAAQNLGFAIPVNNVKPLLDDLRRGVTRATAYLGVSLTNLTPDLAQRFGISADHGALIADQPSGPAAQAGLQQADVIITFDGKDVTSDSALVSLIRAHRPGDMVTLTYVRGHTTRTTTVTLGTRPTGG